MVKVNAVSRGEGMVPVEFGNGQVLDSRFFGEKLRVVVYRKFEGNNFYEITAVTMTVDACDNGCVWSQCTHEQAQQAANSLIFRNPSEVWRSHRFNATFNFQEIEDFLRRQNAAIVAPVVQLQTQPAATPEIPALPAPANEDTELFGFLLAALAQGEVELNANYFARLSRAAAEQGFRFEVAAAPGNGTVVIRGLRNANQNDEKTNVTTMARRNDSA